MSWRKQILCLKQPRVVRWYISSFKNEKKTPPPQKKKKNYLFIYIKETAGLEIIQLERRIQELNSTKEESQLQRSVGDENQPQTKSGVRGEVEVDTALVGVLTSLGSRLEAATSRIKVGGPKKICF